MSLRISVRGALVIVTVASVWAATIFSVQDPFAVPILGLVTLATVVGLVWATIRSNSSWRVFCGGALLGLFVWLGVTVREHYAVNDSHEGLAEFDDEWEAHRRWEISTVYRGFMLLLPVVCCVAGLLTLFPYSCIKLLVWAVNKKYDIAPQQEDRESALAQWTCVNCAEPNEPTFEICWNCQTVRDETT